MGERYNMAEVNQNPEFIRQKSDQVMTPKNIYSHDVPTTKLVFHIKYKNKKNVKVNNINHIGEPMSKALHNTVITGEKYQIDEFTSLSAIEPRAKSSQVNSFKY